MELGLFQENEPAGNRRVALLRSRSPMSRMLSRDRLLPAEPAADLAFRVAVFAHGLPLNTCRSHPPLLMASHAGIRRRGNRVDTELQPDGGAIGEVLAQSPAGEHRDTA
jgi:hypothetical protein